MTAAGATNLESAAEPPFRFSMRLMRIALSNFRNYEQLELEPAAGLNAFVGPNAQGKSNLLEAIAMLGTGKSFRSSRDGDAVRWGTDRAIVRGEARINAR